MLSLSRECPLQRLSIRVKQVLAEVVIARSERILGGNTEVKAFVLSVQFVHLRAEAFLRATLFAVSIIRISLITI